MGYIRNVKTRELGEVLAGLMKEGLAFTVTPENNLAGEWRVEITGY